MLRTYKVRQLKRLAGEWIKTQPLQSRPTSIHTVLDFIKWLDDIANKNEGKPFRSYYLKSEKGDLC